MKISIFKNYFLRDIGVVEFNTRARETDFLAHLSSLF